MRLLAIETSSPKATVALFEDAKCLQTYSLDQPFSQAEVLNSEIDKILNTQGIDLKALDAFAVGVGPGSFTGIRVGINIVKSFSYVLDKPIYPLGSLDNLLFQSGVTNQIAAVNAFNNKVYIGQGLGKAAEVWSIEQAKQFLDTRSDIQVIGDGRSLIAENSGKSEFDDFPSAVRMGNYVFKNKSTLKPLDWKSISPIYLRSLKAEDH
jgi:tRNA threonylcarbamoyladenosine biosynthesis protein TsaB